MIGVIKAFDFSVTILLIFFILSSLCGNVEECLKNQNSNHMVDGGVPQNIGGHVPKSTWAKLFSNRQ